MEKAARSYKPKNILITGGAGFIGSGVCLHLHKKYSQDYNFVVVDKLSYNGNIKNLDEIKDHDSFTFVKANILNLKKMLNVMQVHEIDTIMHFAAETHVDRSFLNSIQFTQTNVLGTHVLLEVCRLLKSQIRRFIHVSTDEVYGTCLSEAKTEASTFEPTNPYAATKAAAEHLVDSYRISYGVPTIITRGSNVYGPRQFPDKLIPKFIKILERDGNLPIHGDGSVLRSFIHVDDVAGAFDVVLHKALVGEIYNVSNGFEATVLDVSHALLNCFNIKNHEDRLDFTRDRNFNDKRYFISHEALENLVWESKIGFEEGLLDTINWYRDHPNHWEASLVDMSLTAHPDFILDDKSESNASGDENDEFDFSLKLSATEDFGEQAKKLASEVNMTKDEN